MTAAFLRSVYLAVVLAFGCNAPHANRVVDANAVIGQDHSEDFTQAPELTPISISYIEQDNGIRVPTTDWSRGETRYLNLTLSGFIDWTERTDGRIEHEGELYDCMMNLIDSNDDGAYDLVRLTADYRTRRHYRWGRWEPFKPGRAIIQDLNFDGITDVMFQDIYDGRRRGFDGIYELMIENEGGNPTMEYFIDHWIIFVPPT